MTAPALYLKTGFIEHSAALFDELRHGVAWDERMRARKTASFGVPYDYFGISYPQTTMLPCLAATCDAIERDLGFVPNNCLLNFYPDGDASMGFHSDSSEELAEGTGVAIVSLGAARTIIYRSKRDKSLEYSYVLESGTLLFMSNRIQDEWLHAIPREAGVGERISLTFRQIIK